MNNSYDKNKFIDNKIKSYYKAKYTDKQIKKKKRSININKIKKGGVYKVYASIKLRIYKTFKQNNLPFDISYSEILGCTIEELQIHISSNFKEGMTFENHGEWEVDHIIPVSSFDFTIRENIFKCFNYTNLQPLWKDENRQKSNKIDYNLTI